MIATYYDGGGAIPMMLKFSPAARTSSASHLVFNTGRLGRPARAHDHPAHPGRLPGRRAVPAQQGRDASPPASSAAATASPAGHTLIANVGNNHTDFAGDGYERAYRLPNYGVLG